MTQSKTLDIFFVEDNDVIRFCLKAFLKKISDFNAVGECADGVEAIQQIKQAKPTVALIDIGLPGMNGIELTQRLKSDLPELKILMLTASDNENDIFASLDAGADGYVLKGDFSTNLEMAIRKVEIGSIWLDPGIAKQVLELTKRPLTPAVQRAVGVVQEELSNEEEQKLNDVAQSNCMDGVCLVDPGFLKRLKRFSTTEVNIPTLAVADNES